MKEIEIKILNISPRKISEQLVRLGANKGARLLVVEKMFDFKDTRLSRRRRSLRLRKVGGRFELTHKTGAAKSNGFKVQNETQTEVLDFDSTEQILRLLGLKCIKHREKYRTSFKIGTTAFEIDEYPHIPPYLEIEGAPDNIKKYVGLLGFTMQDTSNESSTNVLKKYRVRHDFLTFTDRRGRKTRA